jgi:Cu-processing system ATP-binding protein
MITFREFSKTFARRAAVSDLTLSIEPGEVMALLGPNGSGKTTSIKAAAGLITPTTGTVEIGRPPRPASDPDARRICAFLPQKVTFPEQLTGRDVLEFYCALRGQSADRVEMALVAVSLGEASRRYAGTYSGGMTQRLGLAVALMSDAPLLLLDEPTAALDPDGLAAFHALVGHRRGLVQTTVFSSHQLDDVERLADRVAVLVEGRLTALLTASELAECVAGQGVMRLHTGPVTSAALADVHALAPETTAGEGVLLVRGASVLRPAVLAVLARHHVEIRSLTVQEGRLDQWYHELVSATSTEGVTPAGRSETTPALDASGIGRALWCSRLLKERR